MLLAAIAELVQRLEHRLRRRARQLAHELDEVLEPLLADLAIRLHPVDELVAAGDIRLTNRRASGPNRAEVTTPRAWCRPFLTPSRRPSGAALEAARRSRSPAVAARRRGPRRVAGPVVDAEDLVAFVAPARHRRSRRRRPRRPAPGRSLPRVRVRARADTRAIAAFDRDYMREVDIALARMRIGPPRLADVKQLVRQRLFVGGGTAGVPTSAGKIAEYGGRGDLRRWVRSVAVRTCLNDLRKGKREILVDDDQLIAQHAIAQDDPEVEYMKRTYANEFKAAFAAGAGSARARASRRCCATTTSTASTSTRSARSTASTGSPRSAGSRRRRSSSCKTRSRRCARACSCRRTSSTACCA